MVESHQVFKLSFSKRSATHNEHGRLNMNIIFVHFNACLQVLKSFNMVRLFLFLHLSPLHHQLIFVFSHKPLRPGHPRVKVSIVGSLRDREVACSVSDRQGSNFESCVWRTVSSQSSHHPQEILLAQFSLYVHKGGLKPDSFHFLRPGHN